jgi:hypothetical protein
MTFITLITVNALLGAGLVYALVHLLGLGIHHDHRARVVHAARVEERPSEERDRLAA